MDALKIYRELQKIFIRNVQGAEVTADIRMISEESLKFLTKLKRTDLISLVPDKKYFAFQNHGKNGKLSRAVNSDLFLGHIDYWDDFYGILDSNKKFPKNIIDEINQLIYTIAISFCCVIDLIKEGDQKTPGTFFEYLIGHLFAKRLKINPVRSLPVLNMDLDTQLPTDFVFNLGVNKAKFHLPIKTSTRERVIQVWAHQRVLDGVYGTGRFLGTPVILAETKSNKRKREVIEICLPDQWRLYQMHIAQLKRIYYLDIPQNYNELNQVFPPINVKTFGEFFFEADSLGA